MKPLAAPLVTRLTFLQRKLAAPSRCVCECSRIGCRAWHRPSLPLSRWKYIEKRKYGGINNERELPTEMRRTPLEFNAPRAQSRFAEAALARSFHPS